MAGCWAQRPGDREWRKWRWSPLFKAAHNTLCDGVSLFCMFLSVGLVWWKGSQEVVLFGQMSDHLWLKQPVLPWAEETLLNRFVWAMYCSRDEMFCEKESVKAYLLWEGTFVFWVIFFKKSHFCNDCISIVLTDHSYYIKNYFLHLAKYVHILKMENINK